MSENTKLWEILGRTDPAHTKSFTRGGGFKGTAIKPMWSYKRMTEHFGPCGIGWGVGEPTFQVVPGPEGEMLVYCTTYVWFKEGEEVSQRVYGVGGDKAVGKNKYGLQTDDEAFKKAFTDAVTNALKLIGVGADVHMGLFDDSKYVNDMRAEFAEEPADKPKSSAQLKRDGFWPDFERELDECHTLIALDKFKAAWRDKAKKDGWTAAWKAAAKDRIEGRENAIRDEMDRLAEASPDELADVPLNAALEHSLRMNPLNAG